MISDTGNLKAKQPVVVADLSQVWLVKSHEALFHESLIYSGLEKLNTCLLPFLEYDAIPLLLF